MNALDASAVIAILVFVAMVALPILGIVAMFVAKQEG